ncbi:MAG TPA: LD-carboxypeptidase [Clostridia bacterium]|nr:LD-carboxypeptidase [Clostridia bacterium]
MGALPRPKLFPGARVAIVGPSSHIGEGKIDQCARAAESMGLVPVVYASADSRRGYLSGTDELRAADLNAAFADASIDGIWPTRGGYGAHRLLPLIDFGMIRRNPKFFGGFSDITALLTAITQTCGFVTYHCLMSGSEAFEKQDAYSLDRLRALFFGEKGDYANPEGCARGSINGGRAEGRLCGGNLSLLAASMGTPWEIDTKGKILFIEDINERPYRVDAYLTQLRNAGKLADCAGILVGQFTDCEAEKPEKSLSLDEVFQDLLAPAGKPVITNVVCGHCIPSMGLPMGAEFYMDADAGEFGEV